MVTINENIRWYKPNDPYYYEVDNLPLIDLLSNDKSLLAAILALEANNIAYVTFTGANLMIQTAIGDESIIDIDAAAHTGLPYSTVIDWVESKNYLQQSATKIGDLVDVDTSTITPVDGDLLRYDSNTGGWNPSPQGEL